MTARTRSTPRSSTAVTPTATSFFTASVRPPLLDPYKVADYMKQYPLAIQDIAAANIARRYSNTQKMAQDITAAYFAGNIKLTPKLALTSGVRAETTENFVRGPLRVNSAAVIPGASALDQQLALFSKTQRVTSKYTDYFPNFQATYRFTPGLPVPRRDHPVDVAARRADHPAEHDR